MKTIIIIPARMASTRFPNKPLIDIQGKSMVQRVWETCIKTDFDVIVATDSQMVADVINDLGGRAVITEDCNNGTERCYLALKMIDPENKIYDKIINVQGDLPFVTKQQIVDCSETVDLLSSIGTVVTYMDPKRQNDPNTVKAICSEWGLMNIKESNIAMAKWFLRAPLNYGYHHLGIYAYTPQALETYMKYEQSEHEKLENLEQLRFLDNGYEIRVKYTSGPTIEINSPEDLKTNNLV